MDFRVAEDQNYIMNEWQSNNINNYSELDSLQQEELKTITQKEYEALMQLNIQVNKYKSIIDEMAMQIKIKDAKIRELESRNEENKIISLAHLTNVSVLFLNSGHFGSFKRI